MFVCCCCFFFFFLINCVAQQMIQCFFFLFCFLVTAETRNQEHNTTAEMDDWTNAWKGSSTQHIFEQNDSEKFLFIQLFKSSSFSFFFLLLFSLYSSDRSRIKSFYVFNTNRITAHSENNISELLIEIKC